MCNSALEGAFFDDPCPYLHMYPAPAPTVPPKIYAENHKDIEKKIFEKYETTRRPVKNASDPIKVGMEFTINHLSIDEKYQTMTMSGLLNLWWNDEYLIWDPKNYGKVSKIYVNKRNIWRPQLNIENGAGKNYIFWNSLANVVSNGENKSTVMIQTKYDFKVGCSFDFVGFPKDGIRCPILIAFKNASSKEISFDSSNSSSEIRFPKATTANYIINRIYSNELLICTSSSCDSNLSTTFLLQRIFPYMFVIFKLPSIICSLLNVLSFFIASKAICCYLTMSNILLEFIFLHDMMKKLPQSSDLPKCLIYYLMMVTLTFITLLFHFATLFGVQVIDEKKRPNRIQPIIGIILALTYLIVGYFYL